MSERPDKPRGPVGWLVSVCREFRWDTAPGFMFAGVVLLIADLRFMAIGPPTPALDGLWSILVWVTAIVGFVLVGFAAYRAIRGLLAFGNRMAKTEERDSESPTIIETLNEAAAPMIYAFLLISPFILLSGGSWLNTEWVISVLAVYGACLIRVIIRVLNYSHGSRSANQYRPRGLGELLIAVICLDPLRSFIWSIALATISILLYLLMPRVQ